MAFVRYEELSIRIAVGATQGPVMSQNVSVNENLPLTPIRSLGKNGAVSTTATGPMDGSWSLSFLPTSPDAIGDGLGGCKGANLPDGMQDVLLTAPQQSADVNDAASVVKMWWNTSDAQPVSQAMFNKGAATSFTMSLEPNNLITATLEGNFYDKDGIANTAQGKDAKGTLVGGAGSGAGLGGLPMAHASTSGPTLADVSAIGFGTAPFNISYTASRGLTPIYTLRSLVPVFIMPTDPQESVTLQGDDMPRKLVKNLSTPLCVDAIDIAFEVNDTCDNPIYSKTELAICGYIQSRDIAVATDDVLRGNVTIIDYNYPQIIGD